MAALDSPALNNSFAASARSRHSCCDEYWRSFWGKFDEATNEIARVKDRQSERMMRRKSARSQDPRLREA